MQPAPPRRRPGQEADLIGQTIEGKYLLSAVLGRGGMGTVYDATHRLTNRPVAVKVLLPEHAEKPDAIARFHHEARVVSAMGHSNICEILDFGRLADGRPFLVMERLEGETLGERLDRKVSLKVPEAVSIVRQALRALEAAHTRGVIHRDMKPDNVFLVKRAGAGISAKVLDFGISKALGDDRDVELTRTGMVMGTPYYMAPEQARGDRDLDGRVDVWAVGVLLYEALAGVRPFLAKNYNALLVEILTARQKSLVEHNPRVPPGLAAVVDTALVKKREDRYPTVGAFSDALIPFEGHERSAPAVRPRLDRFVNVGGVEIPVTWEDTGNETPASSGAKVMDQRSLAAAAFAAAPVAPRGIPERPPPVPDRPPPPPVGRRGVLPGGAASHEPPAARSPVPRSPVPLVPGEASRRSEPPGKPPLPGPPGGPVEPRPRAPFRAVQPPRPSSPSVERGAAAGARRPPVGSAAQVREGLDRRPQAAATSRPPIVEDEDTTKVLAGSETSSEAVTPPLRGRGMAVPPPLTPPPPPPEDVETTVVDLDPPTFTTDAYRLPKDRKDR